VVEAIRALRVVRASAVKARTQTVNQIKSLIITAPAAVREALRSLTTTDLVRRLAASRPGTDPAAAGHRRQDRPQAPGQAIPAPDEEGPGQVVALAQADHEPFMEPGEHAPRASGV
jgi:hypothetical protein